MTYLLGRGRHSSREEGGVRSLARVLNSWISMGIKSM